MSAISLCMVDVLAMPIDSRHLKSVRRSVPSRINQVEWAACPLLCPAE